VSSTRLENDASCAKPASLCEDDRAVVRDVLIELDASRGSGQQPCQRGLAVEEWEITHILAVILGQVEGAEDCGSSTCPTG
jgi:hypothetical protein